MAEIAEVLAGLCGANPAAVVGKHQQVARAGHAPRKRVEHPGEPTPVHLATDVRLPHASRPRWFVVGAALLALSAALVIVVQRRAGEAPVIVEPVEQAPAAAGGEAGAGAIEAAPAEVDVTVETRPPGATVVDVADGTVLGVTPLVLSAAPGHERTVELRLAGHAAARALVRADDPLVTVVLDRTGGREAARRRRTKTSRPGVDRRDQEPAPPRPMKKKEMPEW